MSKEPSASIAQVAFLVLSNEAKCGILYKQNNIFFPHP